MKAKIEGYSSFPGDHCGSVAMRGLLHHYCGLDLPEAAVFGLGAGVASVYLRGPQLDPKAILFGRKLDMEASIGRNLEVDYRERREPDDAEAWRVVREEIEAGRPTMLSGDIFYLDYREFKVHFPGHRFVLLGFDDETERVWIADRLRTEAEVCSYGALFQSRNPPEGISTQNLWGRFHGTEVGRDLASAAREAIAECAREMLGQAADAERADGDQVVSPGTVEASTGVAGSRAFAADVSTWASRDDASWIASFNASCIEKFGNGGGNFRRLYAGFLEWARGLDASLVPADAPGLATEAADAWTATASALFRASEEVSDQTAWSEAQRQAERAAELEERLFEQLADRVA